MYKYLTSGTWEHSGGSLSWWQWCVPSSSSEPPPSRSCPWSTHHQWRDISCRCSGPRSPVKVNSVVLKGGRILWFCWKHFFFNLQLATYWTRSFESESNVLVVTRSLGSLGAGRLLLVQENRGLLLKSTLYLKIYHLFLI